MYRLLVDKDIRPSKLYGDHSEFDNFVVNYDEERKCLVVSLFYENHFVNEYVLDRGGYTDE